MLSSLLSSLLLLRAPYFSVSSLNPLHALGGTNLCASMNRSRAAEGPSGGPEKVLSVSFPPLAPLPLPPPPPLPPPFGQRSVLSSASLASSHWPILYSENPLAKASRKFLSTAQVVARSGCYSNSLE